MFNGRLLLFSVEGAFIQSKNIPNKTISSTGYWMERWDCPAVHHKMKLGEASRHVANFMLKPQSSSCTKFAGEPFYLINDTMSDFLRFPSSTSKCSPEQAPGIAQDVPGRTALD